MMRFYLEDDVEGNVATKCLRVCSSSSTLELTGTLSEKFRPDMKTLSSGFALYEIHADKGQRRRQNPSAASASLLSNPRDRLFSSRGASAKNGHG